MDRPSPLVSSRKLSKVPTKKELPSTSFPQINSYRTKKELESQTNIEEEYEHVRETLHTEEDELNFKKQNDLLVEEMEMKRDELLKKQESRRRKRRQKGSRASLERYMEEDPASMEGRIEFDKFEESQGVEYNVMVEAPDGKRMPESQFLTGVESTRRQKMSARYKHESSQRTQRDRSQVQAEERPQKRTRKSSMERVALRRRRYIYELSTRNNMFGGFSYCQYDMFVRKDAKMQKIILRDQLLVLLDKVTTLKNTVSDKGLIKLVIHKNSQKSQIFLFFQNFLIF